MPDFGQMTSAHVVFIPCVLLLGLIVGYTLGARAERAEQERKARRRKE